MNAPPSAEVIVALDFPSAGEALVLADALGDACDFYKVGLELFTRSGPGFVRELRARGKRVFLDLKLLDIPNTVAGAVRAAADEEVELLTVHATGGRRMLETAAAAAAGRVRLASVTLLTSFSPAELEESWGKEISSVREEVLRLAELTRDSGLTAVVASPLETEAVKKRLGESFLVVNPGIRLRGESSHDQSRVTTPGEAVAAGADYLVVGRTITGAADPPAALRAVHADMARTLAGELG